MPEHEHTGFAATADDRFADAVVDREDKRNGLPVRAIFATAARNPGLLLAGAWIFVLVIAALTPTALTSADPLEAIPGDKLLPPSAEHWFGTDQVGRDLYARVVHGSALTLQAATIAVAVGVFIGSGLGLLAGYSRAAVDSAIMRGVDVLLAIPSLLLALVLITVLGTGTLNIAIAVGIASVASVTRVMRSQVLRVRTSVFVDAAKASGNTPLRTMLLHVLPNSTGPVLVLATLEFATAILAVSALSFLGYGAQPPAPEWGSLVSTGRDFLRGAWWLTTLPGLVIAITVLSVNAVSHALDAPTKRNHR